MCGIAGIVQFDSQPAQPIRLKKMLQAVEHRGPDGEGTHFGSGVAVGHRRLAIIDIARGQQPVSNEDDSVWLCFNGEIYNFAALRTELRSKGHVFRSESDSEVIVHAYEEWGSKCVSRLRGMFAFALIDENARKVVLAIDHFGIKPLYYCRVGNELLFASEIQAIVAALGERPSVDNQAVDYFLRYQYIPAPVTIYEGVRKLEPATVVEFHYGSTLVPGDARVDRYWDVNFRADSTHTASDAIDAVDAAMTDAVRASVVSDVPYGVLLSGGVDSTLVAHKVSSIVEEGVPAFTITFPEQKYSELAHAEYVAKQLGMPLHVESVSGDAFDHFDEIISAYGEPFGDSSAVPTWFVSKLASQHVKMVLSGDGGDESFGGYRSYRRWLRSDVGDSASSTVRSLARMMVRPSIRNAFRTAYAATYRSRVWNGMRQTEWESGIGYFSTTERQALWKSQPNALLASPSRTFSEASRNAPSKDLLSYAQYMDFHTYLPSCILHKVDIASMAHGLEVRPPLLSVDLVEVAARLPQSLRVSSRKSGSQTKVALRKVLAKSFDPGWVNRPKQGFALPRDHWFLPGGKAHQRLHGMIEDSNSCIRTLFEASSMKTALKSHSLESDRSHQLWLLLVLGTWLEKNQNAAFS